MIRSLLLFLSKHRLLRRWVETSRIAAPLTKRFVAGLHLQDGLEVCQQLKKQGILGTLDYLGENVTSRGEASASRDAYIDAIERIAQLELDATVSIKLTHFGMDVSEHTCHKNVEMLVQRAKQLGRGVEVDMESVGYVDRTLRLVTEMHERYGSVRGVIQSYLRRSEKDVEMLCEKGVPVRLCKGAYVEPASVAFPHKAEVDQNYLRLMKILLERGVYPGLATHDEKMVGAIKRYAAELGCARDQFEFQMLYGVRKDLQRQLVDAGYRLRLYVPCGESWYPYLMRRLAERPSNVLFLILNSLKR